MLCYVMLCYGDYLDVDQTKHDIMQMKTPDYTLNLLIVT